MGINFKCFIKSSLLLPVILLSGCALQGPFFTPQGAGQSVKVNNKMVKPTLVPINASLYANTFGKKATKNNPSLWYTKAYGYKIGPTDVLTITVWNHPELSTPLRLDTVNTQDYNSGLSQLNGNISPGILVDSKGNIFFPYAGTLHVAGMTTNDLRIALTHKLARYIKQPQVNVRVSAFRSQTIQVLGAVEKQGSVPLTDHPLTILDAIATRGGVSNQSADTHHIFVIRGHGLKPLVFMLDADSPSNLLIAQHFKLYNNDIVYVPQSSLANWNTFISQILPTVETIAYTRTIS